MAKATVVTAGEIKVGDKIGSSQTRSGHEVVTKVYFSGKYVHITTASGTKAHLRSETMVRIG